MKIVTSRSQEKNVMNKYYYSSLIIGNIIILFSATLLGKDIDNSNSMNSNFYASLRRHKDEVITSLIISFFVSTYLIGNIIFDIIYDNIDILERFIVLFYTIISNIVLISCIDLDSIFSIYLYLQMLQHMAFISVIIAICIKLKPDYFAKKSILIALIAIAIAGCVIILSCNTTETYSTYAIVGIILMAVSHSILLYNWFTWIYNSILKRKNDNLSSDDVILVFYIAIATVLLLLIPFIPSVLCGLTVRNFAVADVLLFNYANIMFNIMIGSAPSRIKNYMLNFNKKREEVVNTIDQTPFQMTIKTTT